MKLVVKVIRQEEQSEKYKVRGKQVVYMGRVPQHNNQQNTIVDDHESVSRTHAKLMNSNDGAVLMDCGSSNGTYLNGQILQPNKEYKLCKGDTVRLADSTVIIKIVKIEAESEQKEDRSNSRSRSRERKGTEVSESTRKMIEGLQKYKSKEEKIKFLKLMGHKNAQAYLQQLEMHSKSKPPRVNFEKVNEEIERQFEQGRKGGPTKKGLGS